MEHNLGDVWRLHLGAPHAVCRSVEQDLAFMNFTECCNQQFACISLLTTEVTVVLNEEVKELDSDEQQREDDVQAVLNDLLDDVEENDGRDSKGKSWRAMDRQGKTMCRLCLTIFWMTLTPLWVSRRNRLKLEIRSSLVTSHSLYGTTHNPCQN